MAEACCGGDTVMADVDDAVSFWRLRDVRLAALSALFLFVGLAASVGGTGGIGNVAFVGALVAGGATFVPSSLRRILRGQLGVGTLMTIAAIGAVLLGELGEAASLAFLFSISEALEDYAMDRTRRGLRALLDLVPETVTVGRDGAEEEINPTPWPSVTS